MLVTTRTMKIISISALAVLVPALVVGHPQGALATGPSDASDTGGSIELMTEFPASDFVEAASELPNELVEALHRDLNKSGAEYLAESEAAIQAVEVVESLRNVGVDVLGSSIDGTTLTVNVGSQDDMALVESTGALVVVGAPESYVPPKVELSFSADIYGGQGYYWEVGDFAYQCSIGFNGFLTATGAPQLATAGHCVEGMTGITGSVLALNLASPGSVSSVGQLGNAIGLPVSGSLAYGSSAPGYDLGRISAGSSGLSPKASVLTWGGGGGGPLSSAPRGVTGESAGIIGATLCKSGSRTGWRCGPVVDVDYSADVEGLVVNSIVAEVCSLPGDSGGAAMIGTAAVGISSWTNLGGSTCTPTAQEGVAVAGFFPMVSPGASVRTAYGTSWELAVSVPTPLVTTPRSASNPTAISGTLASASASNNVALYLDGQSVPFANVSGSTGSWSVPLTGVGSGLHSYVVKATYGTKSVSAPASGTFSVGASADRLQGPSRYATGIKVAQAAYPGTVPVLYLSTGQNYPDALSAGPAAVHLGGPVLLVQPDTLSDDVKAAIAGFDPDEVIVLGASNSISTAVFDQVSELLPTSQVRRLEGNSRYATSRLVNQDAFLDRPGSAGADTVFIANGGNFPDALSAGPAAASVNGAVLLVDGPSTAVPAETTALLSQLNPTRITIVGSAASVSLAIENQLRSQYPSVTIVRLGGANRYETSRLINSTYFSAVEPRVFIATGEGYPDALAGSALAGSLGAPLYTTPRICIPESSFADMARLRATRFTLLGGDPSLSSAVESLTRC
jgi:putative cell wall-binding protein